MDSIKLPSVLILIWDIKRCLESQKAPVRGVETFNSRLLKDPFAILVADWASRQKNASSTQIIRTGPNLNQTKTSIYQQQMMQLLNQSLNGISIYQNLCDLEREVVLICEDDIEKHVQTLPLLLQIPLLGLIFPAIMMILVVPILNMLTF